MQLGEIEREAWHIIAERYSCVDSVGALPYHRRGENRAGGDTESLGDTEALLESRVDNVVSAVSC